jgi:4-hydroxythreonine-4-phosphate dehydrogenase
MSQSTFPPKVKPGKTTLNTENTVPNIAITMGDPAGIGPEVAVRTAQLHEFKHRSNIIIYGCLDVLTAAAQKFCSGKLPEIKNIGTIKIDSFKLGKVSPECGLVAYNAVVAAANDALAGTVDAIVTAPINKASVNMAGIKFTGHTELIASLCGCSNYAMMQSDGNFRVAFVTTHIPLLEVTKAISIERIIEVTRLLYHAVVAEGVLSPRLAVAAINPHAGENGFMGLEDENIVKPAIAILKKSGIDIYGPFPPDTLFIKSVREQFDGIVSMYHDQGHIPFKMLSFDRGVNSTLGLPIIRTSVDHGTAFDIAWQGEADIGSMTAALRLAITRAKYRLKAQ